MSDHAAGVAVLEPPAREPEPRPGRRGPVRAVAASAAGAVGWSGHRTG